MKLNKMSIKDLQQLLRNCNNQIETPEAARLAREVVAELQARNAFKPGQWKGRWNAAEVAEALEPFRVIAAAVPGNRNTAFTTAGGLHIGRKHTDPDWKFVDTYSSIRTHRVNAVFSCQVDRPGDDAVFRLFFADLQKSRLKEVVLEGDHTICGVALGRWRVIAALA